MHWLIIVKLGKDKMCKGYIIVSIIMNRTQTNKQRATRSHFDCCFDIEILFLKKRNLTIPPHGNKVCASHIWTQSWKKLPR